MTSGVFGIHVHGPSWRVPISPKYNRAGRTSHTGIGHKSTLIVRYIHLLFASMFVSRPIASVSQSGISVHTRANSFHIMSLLQSASSKKQCAEKRKANPVYEKEKTSKNGKTPGSEQPVVKSVCGSLTMRRRAASAYVIVRR